MEGSAHGPSAWRDGRRRSVRKIRCRGADICSALAADLPSLWTSPVRRRLERQYLPDDAQPSPPSSFLAAAGAISGRRDRPRSTARFGPDLSSGSSRCQDRALADPAPGRLRDLHRTGQHHGPDMGRPALCRKGCRGESSHRPVAVATCRRITNGRRRGDSGESEGAAATSGQSATASRPRRPRQCDDPPVGSAAPPASGGGDPRHGRQRNRSGDPRPRAEGNPAAADDSEQNARSPRSATAGALAQLAARGVGGYRRRCCLTLGAAIPA